MFNSAGLAAGTLAEAEKEVGQVFQEGGIEVRWLDCSAPPDFVRDPDPCKAPQGPADLSLRLAKGPVPADMGVRPNALGLVVNTKQGGVFAFIFCSRLQELVQTAGLPLSRVLSCALSHEMGHLLMGDRPHSFHCLMRGDWDAKDLRYMAMRPLSFLPQESALMRPNLEKRLRSGTGSKGLVIAKGQ